MKKGREKPQETDREGKKGKAEEINGPSKTQRESVCCLSLVITGVMWQNNNLQLEFVEKVLQSVGNLSTQRLKFSHGLKFSHEIS